MFSEAIRLRLAKLNIKLYADSGSLSELREWANWQLFDGVTSNPSLMYQAGQKDYLAFAKQLLIYWPSQPVSLATIGDSPKDMLRQARILSELGANVFVKIPILNRNGEFTYDLIQQLLEEGIKVNVTCLMDLKHIAELVKIIPTEAVGYLSIFAGRIADTGRDPCLYIEHTKALTADYPNLDVLWASTRELFNIFDAEQAGSNIITLGQDVIAKLSLIDKDLDDFSLETVKMFHHDADMASYHF